jgi:hypothetical protein
MADPFVFVKQPSMLATALDETDCPPYGVWHNIADYPTYYDVLHFPEYHTDLFGIVRAFSHSFPPARSDEATGRTYSCLCWRL